jgi:hypothetical protein
LERRLDDLFELVGTAQSARVRGEKYDDIRNAEFRVFSQEGEDGILQYVLGQMGGVNDFFVEIGVDDYRESITRFLLIHDNWRGVVVDAGTRHLDYLESSRLRWRRTVDAVSAFVTRENVCELLEDAGTPRDLGVLALDIDGNDYWVLEALARFRPTIIVVEYNSTFGPSHPVSVPYAPEFRRERAHWSLLYFGASLAAFAHLLWLRGYVFCGSNSAGSNAFFVLKEAADSLPRPSVLQGYVEGRVRESMSPEGEFTYVSDPRDRLALIAHLPLVNVATGRSGTVAEILLED